MNPYKVKEKSNFPPTLVGCENSHEQQQKVYDEEETIFTPIGRENNHEPQVQEEKDTSHEQKPVDEVDDEDETIFTPINDLPKTIYSDLIKEIHRKITADTKLRDNYLTLFAFMAYITLYSVVLYLQRDPATAFQCETAVKEAVFTQNSGLVNGNNYVNRISSGEDIYTFLEQSLLPTFVHNVCGDGVCDAGEKAWYDTAKKGCYFDCGTFSNLTNISITMEWYITPGVLSQSPSSGGSSSGGNSSNGNSSGSGGGGGGGGGRRRHLLRDPPPPPPLGLSGEPTSSSSNDGALKEEHFLICEKNEGYCIPSDDLIIVEGGTFSQTFELFDGEWSILMDSDTAISGSIKKVTMDEEEQLKVQDAAWQETSDKALMQQRYEPHPIYKYTELTSWVGCEASAKDSRYVCAKDATNPENCNAVGTKNEVHCSDGCPVSWLADGQCDDACRTSTCGYDNGDCCAQEDGMKDKLVFVLNEYGGEIGDDSGVFNKRTKPASIYLGRAGANRLLGGVLVTQKRTRTMDCECLLLSTLIVFFLFSYLWPLISDLLSLLLFILERWRYSRIQWSSRRPKYLQSGSIW